MSNITVNLIKKLRYNTGLGIVECKNALLKSNGNIKLAIDFLRKSGVKNFLEITKKTSKEGVILSGISKDNKYGIIVELNSETDFVTKNKYFKKFCKDIINISLLEKISNIEILKNKLKEKNLFLIKRLKENIKINRFNFLKGNYICSYIHNNKIGVLLSANKYDSILKNVSMHIASNNPKFIDINNIPKKILDHEYKIQKNIAKKLKKPKEIYKKIIQGRIEKFSKDITLNNQYFIFNTKKIVKDILKKNKIIINDFIYMKVGETNKII